MNVSMNINNMLNQVQNNINVNKQTSFMDKNTFLKMLTMKADKNSSQFPIDMDNSYMSSNIMELMTGNNGINYMDLLNTNEVDTDGLAVNNSEIEKSDVENDLESLIGIQSYLNFITPEFMHTQLNSENITQTANTDFQYMPFANLNNIQNLKYEVFENKLNANNDQEITSNMESGINMETVQKEKTQMSSLAEKLIEDIEGKRDKLKNEINLHAEMLANNKTLNEGQNKIVNVSDESTQIKSQVLSQIKDKIVIMAEKGTETGDTVKHVTMELHPNDLGKVDIKMTIVNNKVSVEVKALNEETQKIIASSADELAKILSKTSEVVNIVVKSNDLSHEHQQINYYNRDVNEQNNNPDDQNYDQGRQKNNYYHSNEDNKNIDDDDDTFSELINLRSIKLNL